MSPARRDELDAEIAENSHSRTASQGGPIDGNKGQ